MHLKQSGCPAVCPCDVSLIVPLIMPERLALMKLGLRFEKAKKVLTCLASLACTATLQRAT